MDNSPLPNIAILVLNDLRIIKAYSHTNVHPHQPLRGITTRLSLNGVQNVHYSL